MNTRTKSAAVTAAAFGTSILVVTHHASALYPLRETDTDTFSNWGSKTTNTTTFTVGGQDQGGWARGSVEYYNGPVGGLQGVRVNLTTQGGSNYLKGFVRCRKDQDTDDFSNVYTHYEEAADSTKYTSYCSWLNGGGLTWTRVGWGGAMMTLEEQESSRYTPLAVCAGDGVNLHTDMHVLNWERDDYNSKAVTDWVSGNVLSADNEDIVGIFEPITPKCW